METLALQTDPNSHGYLGNNTSAGSMNGPTSLAAALPSNQDNERNQPGVPLNSNVDYDNPLTNSNRVLFNNSTFYINNYVQPEAASPTSPKRDKGLEASSYTKESEPFALPKRSNTIYETQLMCKGRGFPLWIPQPNLRLPPSHRAKGVSIGDVGIITDYGAFDFLFNICVPANDPINPPDLPKGFTTLNLKPWDVREFRDFPNGSYLASQGIGKAVKGEDRRVTTFESSANESALLAMPEGAYHEEVNDLSNFRDYAERHVESWYDFAINQRGRKDTASGDIRLVVGVDKSTSWGIASFSGPFKLQLRETEDVKTKTDPPYTWEHTGMSSGEVKAGPDSFDNQDICQSSDGKIRNQTLFVRTLNILLGKGAWDKIQTPKDLFGRQDQAPELGLYRSSSDVPVSTGSLDMIPARVPKRPISPTIDSVSTPQMSPRARHAAFNHARREVWDRDQPSYFHGTWCSASTLPQRVNPSYSEEEEKLKYPWPTTEDSRMVYLRSPKKADNAAIRGELSSEGRPIDGIRLGPRVPLSERGYLYALQNLDTPRETFVAHPSLTLNSWMLGASDLPSTVKMAITHDSAWYAILVEESLSRAYIFRLGSSQPHPFEEGERDILQSLYDTRVSPDGTAVYLESKERYSDEYPIRDISILQRTLADLRGGSRNIENYLFGRQWLWQSGYPDAHRRQAHIRQIKTQLILESNSTSSTGTRFRSLKPLHYHPGFPVTLDILLQLINGKITLGEATSANSVGDLRRTLRTVCDDDTQAPAVLRRLANALLNHAGEFTNKDNVEEAIFYYRYLEPITSMDSYQYLELVQGLSTAYYFRHQLLHMREDLVSLIKYLDIQNNLDYMSISRSFRDRVMPVV